MIALDPLLEMLGDMMDGIGRQEPGLYGRPDCNRERCRTVGADRRRRQERFVFQYLAEEALRCIGIALGRQQEVDRVAWLVDRTGLPQPCA